MWLGEARQGYLINKEAWHGRAWRGVAGLGMVRRGKAGQGEK